MAKHARKRQKVDARQPLGSSNVDHSQEEDKDDEERRLEELIFGIPFIPSSNNKGKGKGSVESEEEEEEHYGTGKEMDGLLDSDLFFIDGGVPPASNVLSDHSDHESGGDEDEDEEEGASSSGHAQPQNLTSVRKAAWSDPADAPLSISVAASDPSTSKRLLKLRDAPDETVLSGREYERRLRRQFTKINPEPTWAAKAREKIHGTSKRRRSSISGSEDEQEDREEVEESGIDHLLTSTSGLLKSTRRQKKSKFLLPPTTLNISRLRDANQSAQSSGCGEIKSLAFHPNADVPLLCVASADRRYRLFHIDGHTSPLLQTLHVPSLPPTSTSVTFHPRGSHLLLTGARPYYFTYDLQAEKMHQSTRGLWGTTFSGANDVSSRLDKSGGKRGRGKDGGEPIEIHTFDPTDGSLLAVAGRGGYIHLVDWKSGSGQVIDSMKMSSAVKGLWWGSLPSIYSEDQGQNVGGGDYLISLSNDSEVYIWDVGSRRCVRRWRDEGGFRGAGLVLAGSAHGSRRSLAVGSNTGLVNVYGSEAMSLLPSSSATAAAISANPKPQKTLGQLTTSITSLRFNRDGQILAMASREKKDAMRLVHTPTLTAFANWPTSSTPLGHVTSIDFSAGSEYMAVGNSRGKVLLYYLRDYGV